MVTQWDVEADSAAQLMIDFHRALQAISQNSTSIHGSAEALREAQVKMLSTPNLSRPFFWAGFIVVGDGW